MMAIVVALLLLLLLLLLLGASWTRGVGCGCRRQFFWAPAFCK